MVCDGYWGFVAILEVDHCGHLRGAKGMVTVYLSLFVTGGNEWDICILRRRVIQTINLSDFLEFGNVVFAGVQSRRCHLCVCFGVFM